MTAPWWIYIAQCSDNSYYTGISTNVAKRIAQHNAGAGAKYTKAKAPVSLLYCEIAENRSLASKREHAIKQLSRPQKEQLIQRATSIGMQK